MVRGKFFPGGGDGRREISNQQLVIGQNILAHMTNCNRPKYFGSYDQLYVCRGVQGLKHIRNIS